MGVEPTRDRLAAPTGFEVRPPHRGRFSSSAEKIGAMGIDAPQIAPAQGDSLPIIEVEDLDGHLWEVVHMDEGAMPAD